MYLHQLLFSIQLVASVSGDYLVEVRVQSYNNPTNGCEDFNGGCCDSSDAATCDGQLRCDNQFFYCLRFLNTQATSRGCQRYNTPLRSNINIDGRRIDFTQPTVLGLPNPIRLPGRTNSWQVSINIVSSHNMCILIVLTLPTKAVNLYVLM